MFLGISRNLFSALLQRKDAALRHNFQFSNALSIEKLADPTESKIVLTLWTIFQKWQTKNYYIRKIKAHKKRQYPIADIFLLSNGLATRYYSKTVILPLCYTCQNYPRGNCIFLYEWAAARSSPPHPLSSWLKKQPTEKENIGSYKHLTCPQARCFFNFKNRRSSWANIKRTSRLRGESA